MTKSVTARPLPKLAEEINHTVESTVEAVVRAKMRIGKCLIEAKAQFGSGSDFRDWWENNTILASKQEVSYCIKVAEKFGTASALVKVTSYSALRELVTAPGEDIEVLEQRAAETGKGPSVKEARAIAKSPEVGTPDLPPPPKPLQSRNAGDFDLDAIIAKPFHMRLKWFARNKDEFIKRQTHPSMWALCLFGLDPEPAHPMNPMTATIIYHHFREEVADNEGKKSLEYSIVVDAMDQISRSIAEFYNE